MKTLIMPVRSQPRAIAIARAKRHLAILTKALKFPVLVTLALLLCFAATVALAFTLAVILAVAAAFAAALVFMFVSPEGNLLLLLALSQVWLLYAPRKGTPDRQPDGGLTIKPQECYASRPSQAIAA